MKPENAKGLLAQADVDGGLIGGAALKADSFLAIVNAAAQWYPKETTDELLPRPPLAASREYRRHEASGDP